MTTLTLVSSQIIEKLFQPHHINNLYHYKTVIVMMLKILIVMTITDELLKNLKVEMKHKTRKRNHTFELIHSDLERRKANIRNLY